MEGRDGPAVLCLGAVKPMDRLVPLPSTCRAASSSLWLCQMLNVAAGGFRNSQEGGRWKIKYLLFSSKYSVTFCFAKPQLSSQPWPAPQTQDFPRGTSAAFVLWRVTDWTRCANLGDPPAPSVPRRAGTRAGRCWLQSQDR